MDFGRFEEFWQRLAHERFDAQGELTVEAILERALHLWRSCVVCNLLQTRAFDLVSRWQYVLSSNPIGQAEFVASQTWCNAHASLFKEVIAPRDLARLHRKLQEVLQAHVGGALRNGVARLCGATTAQVLRELIGDRRCPLCDDRAALEALLLEALARGLRAGALRSAFARSSGCCMPHVAALLCEIADEDTARSVLETVVAQSSRLAQELDTYEAETESRRRRYGAAADAPVRAMICWAGIRGMVQDCGHHTEVPAGDRQAARLQKEIRVLQRELARLRSQHANAPATSEG